MTKKISHVLFSLLLLVAITFAVATPALADAPAAKKSAAKFEIKFMKNMIDHHMMAIMEAEMCLEEAVHAELYQLCESIIATQSEEMMMMQSWLLEWYGISYEPQMKGNMMDKLGSLEGEEFEIMFMEMMIKHHRSAIKDSEKCLDRAYHPELLSTCQGIIDTQSQEIQLMQGWLCEWYTICKNK